MTIDDKLTDLSTYELAQVNHGPESHEPWSLELIAMPTPSTPADAYIALRIGAGSREYDPFYDFNGDNYIISLDTLMILQAAAGAISL
jgi:hypothetical protein